MEGYAYVDVFKSSGDAVVISSYHTHAHFHCFSLFVSYRLVLTDQEIRGQAEQHLAQAIEAQYVSCNHVYFSFPSYLSLQSSHCLILIHSCHGI